MTLIGMGSFQVIIKSFTLVPIWVFLLDLPVAEPLGQIQGNPRCGSPLGIFGTLYLRNFTLASSHPFQYLVHYALL